MMKGCQGKSGEREPNGRNEAEGVLQEGAEDDDQCVAKGGAKVLKMMRRTFGEGS